MTLTFFFLFVLLPLIAFFCFITNIQGDYSSTCGPTNMLRCESGDLSGKHDPLEVGGGRVFFNDVNLPLFGSNSGNNHGVFHNCGLFSLACNCSRYTACSTSLSNGPFRSLILEK